LVAYWKCMGSTIDFPEDEPKLIKGLADDAANMVSHARQHFRFPVRCGEVAGINATNTKSTHIGSDCGSVKEVLDVTRLHRVNEAVDASIANSGKLDPRSTSFVRAPAIPCETHVISILAQRPTSSPCGREVPNDLAYSCAEYQLSIAS